MKTLNNLQLLVDDGLGTTITSKRSNIIGWTFASFNTVSMTVLTLPKCVVILGVGTLGHTERSILHMFTLFTFARTRTGAGQVALGVTLHAGLVVRALVEALHRVAGLHALRLRHEVLAGETQLVARPPTSFCRALGVTNVAFDVTFLRSLVVLEQRVVGLGLHDLLPADVLCIAQVIVLQNGHAARSDLVQRFQI